MVSADDAIQRLKTLLHASTDEELAETWMHVRRQNITNWRNRGNALNEKIINRNLPGISWEWLISGEGEPFLPTPEGRALREKVSTRHSGKYVEETSTDLASNQTGEAINRLKKLFGARTDDSLAAGLRVNRGNIVNWRNRDSLTRRLAERRIPGVNWEWLTTGNGDPFLPTPEGRALKERVGMHRDSTVREDTAEYTAPVTRIDEGDMHTEFQRLCGTYGLRERWEDLPEEKREAFRREYILMLGELRRVQAEYEQRLLVSLIEKKR